MTDDVFEDIESEVSDVLGGGAYMLVGMVVTNLLGFWIHVKLATALEPDGYGALVIGLMIISMGASFLQFGLGQGIARYIPRCDTIRERMDVVKSGLLVPIGGSAVFAVALFVSAPTVAIQVFNDPSLVKVLRYVSLVVPVGVASKLVISIVRGYELARGRMISMVVEKVSLVALIYLLGSLLTPVSAVLVWGGAFGVGIAVGIYVLLRESPRLISSFATAGTTHKRELLVFSAPLIVSGTFTLLMNNVDTFLIGYFLESSMVAKYNVAYKLSNFTLLPLGFVGFIYFPISSRLYKNGEIDKLQRLLKLVNKWGTMAVFPVLFVFLAYPKPAVTAVFGEQYEISGEILRILTLGYILHLVSGKTGGTLKTGGYTTVVMYTSVVGVVANVGLNLILIPWMGIEGAAIATGSSFVASGLLGIAYLRAKIGFWPISTSYLMQMIRGVAAGVLAVLSLQVVRQPLLESSALFLVISTVLFILFYLAVNQIGNGFSEETILVDLLESATGVNMNIVRKILL